MKRPTAKTAALAADQEKLSIGEKMLIEAVRRIPAEDGERYRRTMAIIEYVNALADGMRSANV